MKIRTTIGIVAILPILSALAGTERVVSDGATFIQGGSFRDEVQGALSTVQIKNSENRSHIRIAMIHFPAIQGDVTDAKLDVVQAELLLAPAPMLPRGRSPFTVLRLLATRRILRIN